MSHIVNRIDAWVEILPGINWLTGAARAILGPPSCIDAPLAIVPLHKGFGRVAAHITATIKSPNDIVRIRIAGDRQEWNNQAIQSRLLQFPRGC